MSYFNGESDEAVEKNLDKMEEELADVLIYAILFANETHLDLVKIINNKLQKNNEKYPIEIGLNTKYNGI